MSSSPSTAEKEAEAASPDKGKAKGKSDERKSDEKPVPKTRGEKFRGYLREVIFLGVLVLVVLSARSSFADHYYVPSGSMLPTVEIGDHLVVNKLAYGLRLPFTEIYLWENGGPREGDVVVLESPQDGTILLKRVVGIPGDDVEVRGGKLTIDGHPIAVTDDAGKLREALGAHAHGIRLTYGGGPDWGPEKLGKDQYLVMGDNRGESHDGRAFGLVTRESILGRAVAIYWRKKGGFTWDSLE